MSDTFSVPLALYEASGRGERRWLEGFQVDPIEQTVIEMWIGHRDDSTPTCRDTLTSSYSSDFLETPIVTSVGAEHYVAREALHVQLNRNLPTRNHPDGFTRRMMRFAESVVFTSLGWSTEDVIVGDNSASFRYLQFAEDKVGVVRRGKLPPIGLITPTGFSGRLKLSKVEDFSKYGFEKFLGVSRESISNAVHRPSNYHPDYSQFFED
ncbi:hypothetical protein [Amycolatopsis ultiminotia]